MINCLGLQFTSKNLANMSPLLPPPPSWHPFNSQFADKIWFVGRFGFLPPHVLEQNLWGSLAYVFVSQMLFLLPNQRCQITDRKLSPTIVNIPIKIF